MIKRIRSAAACAAIAVAASSVLDSSAFAQAIPSFSGADGAGAAASGGRGGDVYHVTLIDQNFSDNRPGTLRYGLGTIPAGGRTIVFDVSGTFKLDKAESSTYHFDGNGWNGSQSRLNVGTNVTIAGQTAPGPVNIMGGQMIAGGTNAILRNVTLAPGYGRQNFRQTDAAPAPNTFPNNWAFDAISINGGTNTIIDHVTTVYATDETISANENANNITIQYSSISQGQNYPQKDAEAGGVTRYTGHALGSLLQAGSNAKISVHHNLYADQKGRLPRVGSEVGTGAFNDFRNNVFYNWYDTAGTGAANQPSMNNFVGNFYLAGDGGLDVVQSAGPDGINGNGDDLATLAPKGGGTTVFNGSNSTGTKVYHSGNVKDTNKDADALDGVAMTNSDFSSSSIQANEYAVGYGGVTDTATAAYGRVLDYVGASYWNRGIVDARLIAETRVGTGAIIGWADDPFTTADDTGTEWKNLIATPTVSRAAGFDTDQDGMPDAWEAKHGLNALVADNNGDFDTDGYTNLEEYINELAEWPASRAIVFNGATNNRYAQITNWDIKWQPSKYDAARIVSGTAIVDAVGQHARTVSIGDTAGQVGALNVTAGWIDVAETLVVGGAGTGALNQSGGTTLVGQSVTIANNGTYALTGGSLATPLLTRSGNGAFNFTGGTLNAGEVTFDLLVAGTGTLAPGLGVGLTTLDGDLTMNGGAIEIQLASASIYDTLLVGDVATLDGELRVLAGYAPTAGTTWTILTAAGGIVGSFDAITPGYAVAIVGNNLVLSLAALPEPTSLAAMAGVGVMVARRRRAL